MPGKFLSKEAQHQIKKRRRFRKTAISVIRAWIIFLVITTIILLNLFTHVFQIVRYSGNGMEPNLSSGQVLLLRKTQDVEEGDIIAFYYNNQVLVRRAICRSGKQISISEDGTVLINNQPIEEDYLTEKSIGQCNIEFPYHVQDNGFFVMGDNRVIAMDSRLKEIGIVSIDRIIGKVILAI